MSGPWAARPDALIIAPPLQDKYRQEEASPEEQDAVAEVEGIQAEIDDIKRKENRVAVEVAEATRDLGTLMDRGATEDELAAAKEKKAELEEKREALKKESETKAKERNQVEAKRTERSRPGGGR